MARVGGGACGPRSGAKCDGGGVTDRDYPAALIPAAAVGGNFVPRRRPVASVELDGELVLYSESDGVLGGPGGMELLNPTAAAIWSCFDGSGTIDEIASDVAEVFGIERGVALRSVIDLTRQLGAAGLVEGITGDAGSPGA